MIKKYNTIQHDIIENMKGGNGYVEKIPSVLPGEYSSNAKVISRLIFQPGCSIGYHVHEGEEEIITILKGKAKYNDQGNEVILEAGDVTICRNGQQHSLANASETDILEAFAVVISV